MVTRSRRWPPVAQEKHRPENGSVFFNGRQHSIAEMSGTSRHPRNLNSRDKTGIRYRMLINVVSYPPRTVFYFIYFGPAAPRPGRSSGLGGAFPGAATLRARACAQVCTRERRRLAGYADAHPLLSLSLPAICETLLRGLSCGSTD